MRGFFISHQPIQSRFVELPTAAPSTVECPNAAGPETRWRPQYTTALATTVNQTGTPCVFGRAHAGTATHRDPSPNK